uniref:Reverse transcriptase domain-containing protein n=1 Tax=Leptobrachium leishanense TaxID=445787 RepID=A0A8C5N1S5_9ANUR
MGISRIQRQQKRSKYVQLSKGNHSLCQGNNVGSRYPSVHNASLPKQYVNVRPHNYHHIPSHNNTVIPNKTGTSSSSPGIPMANQGFTVINLSNFQLNEAHLSVLNKGLSFVPVSNLDKFEWTKDIHLFVRKLALHKVHKTKDEQRLKSMGLEISDLPCLRILTGLLEEQETNQESLTNVHIKSRFTPNFKEFGNLEMFCNLVCAEIDQLNDSDVLMSISDNLTHVERKSLKELESDKSLIIKQSDKGGNVVLMSIDFYERMIYNILDDTDTYARLPKDPTIHFSRQLKDLICLSFEQSLITKSQYEFLLPSSPTIATFYGIPKTHKNINEPPGRPIVSGNDCLTQNASIFLDKILRKYVVKLPSYLRDTKQALQILKGISINKDTLLCSLDVESLYSSIPHDLGLKHIRLFLERDDSLNGPFIEFLVKLTSFVLTHNYFLFKGQYFHQLRGTAMGSSMAPSYANLYLGIWEENCKINDKLLSYIDKIELWLRYIDDVLLLWKGSEEEFLQFVSLLNDNVYNLKFTFEIQKDSISFLDIKISKTDGGTLSTTLYKKATATNSLLHWQSFHPLPLKRGIPVGQYLRLRRICSSDDEFLIKAKKLKDFREKGYPNRHLKRAFQQAMSKSRDNLLQDSKPKNNNIIRCIGTFDRGWNQIYSILDRFWPLLTMGPQLSDKLGARPSVTARRSRNLRDRLVHSHHNPIINKRPTTWLSNNLRGTYQCGHCVACNSS